MKRNIILVVDDDPGVRKISELWISTYFPDNEVLLASGVDEAIKVFESQPIHVVISDWAMPEPGDGFILASKLEEHGFDMGQKECISSLFLKETLMALRHGAVIT